MKIFLFLSLTLMCVIQLNRQVVFAENPISTSVRQSYLPNSAEDPSRVLQLGSDGRMSAAVFKNQEYCRAELERFEFDAHFSVIGAVVYFSGANFKGVEKGVITSSSLKPISSLMARCTAGSIVVFDEVKVVGPDKKQRTIPGATYILY